MSLNATPSSERVHIGIFGKRNAGKSSLINAITGQNLAIVSEAKGTTTDPVYKAMELLPLGPVMIIDTPGIDDEGVLGSLRIQKAYQVLNKTDIALVIIDAAVGPSAEDLRLIKRINAKKIPLLIKLCCQMGNFYLSVLNRSSIFLSLKKQSPKPYLQMKIKHR